jgi:hypothetical protein
VTRKVAFVCVCGDLRRGSAYSFFSFYCVVAAYGLRYRHQPSETNKQKTHNEEGKRKVSTRTNRCLTYCSGSWGASASFYISPGMCVRVCVCVQSTGDTDTRYSAFCATQANEVKKPKCSKERR